MTDETPEPLVIPADEAAAAMAVLESATIVPAGPGDTGRGQPGVPAQAGEHAGTDDREPYGRLVHETRLACEADRAAAEGRRKFNLSPWEEHDDWQRELDMRIASAVAARAVHDAKLEAAEIRKQLLAFSLHMKALRRALAVAIKESEYEAEARPYREALRLLSGEKGA